MIVTLRLGKELIYSSSEVKPYEKLGFTFNLITDCGCNDCYTVNVAKITVEVKSIEVKESF